MDTSNSLEVRGNFRPWDLWLSSDPEDQHRGWMVRNIVDELTKRLIPILHYLAIPTAVTDEGGHTGTIQKVRALPLDMPQDAFISTTRDDRGAELFLREDGKLFVAFKCRHPHDHIRAHEISSSLYHAICRDTEVAWGYFPFGLIIERLNAALKQAEEKREQHLAAIRERGKLLDAMEALLKK